MNFAGYIFKIAFKWEQSSARSRAIIILIIEARSFCILLLHTCESYDFHYGSQHLPLISSGSFSGLEYFHTRMHLSVLS